MEQGRGSPDNQTAESVAAYEQWCKNDPNYHETLARMKRELAVYQERRRKLRDTILVIPNASKIWTTRRTNLRKSPAEMDH